MAGAKENEKMAAALERARLSLNRVAAMTICEVLLEIAGGSP